MNKSLAPFLLVLTVGCTSNGTVIEHSYDKSKTNKYEAENENSFLPNGVGKILYQDGAGIYDDGNEQEANKKMYMMCNGKYEILNRETSTSERSYTVTVVTTFQCLNKHITS